MLYLVTMTCNLRFHLDFSQLQGTFTPFFEISYLYIVSDFVAIRISSLYNSSNVLFLSKKHSYHVLQDIKIILQLNITSFLFIAISRFAQPQSLI